MRTRIVRLWCYSPIASSPKKTVQRRVLPNPGHHAPYLHCRSASSCSKVICNLSGTLFPGPPKYSYCNVYGAGSVNLLPRPLAVGLYHQSALLHHGNSFLLRSHASESVKGVHNTVNTQKGEDKDDNEQQVKPLTQRQRLTKLFAEYGTTAVVIHTVISLTSLGISYAIVSSGIDMVAILEKAGLTGEGLKAKLTSGASTFVIAYACHKVFMPVRIFMTATFTPLVVRRLRAMGFLQHPPKKSSLQDS